MQNARHFKDAPRVKPAFRRVSARIGVSLLLCAAIAACAAPRLEPARWENPDRPRADWKVDRAQCLAFADRRAGEELEIRTGAQRRKSQTPSGGSIRRLLAADDAKRLRADIFRACMEARGYQERPGG